MKVDINENDLLLRNSLNLAIFCLLHGFRCILLPTQQSKKPNPNLNMLNYKFANKLNLPWVCDNGSKQSSLLLWLLLGFERDSLSPNLSLFFVPMDYGKGSQQSSPIPLLFGLCWIEFWRYVSILTILGIYWASPLNIFENVVARMS